MPLHSVPALWYFRAIRSESTWNSRKLPHGIQDGTLSNWWNAATGDWAGEESAMWSWFYRGRALASFWVEPLWCVSSPGHSPCTGSQKATLGRPFDQDGSPGIVKSPYYRYEVDRFPLSLVKKTLSCTSLTWYSRTQGSQSERTV